MAELGTGRRRHRSTGPDELDHKRASKKARVDSIGLLMYVRWFGPSSGQTKVNVLPLRALDGLDQLQELGKELVQKAYPDPQPLPEFLTSPDFCRFTPSRECLAVPGDIVRTELRLVLVHDGWEYCVLKRALTPQPSPADGDMLVTAIEFEGRPEEAILGTLGFRVSLIAYPIIALRKTFLEDVKDRLLRDPAGFKGIL